MNIIQFLPNDNPQKPEPNALLYNPVLNIEPFKIRLVFDIDNQYSKKSKFNMLYINKITVVTLFSNKIHIDINLDNIPHNLLSNSYKDHNQPLYIMKSNMKNNQQLLDIINNIINSNPEYSNSIISYVKNDIIKEL